VLDGLAAAAEPLRPALLALAGAARQALRELAVREAGEHRLDVGRRGEGVQPLAPRAELRGRLRPAEH